MFSLLQPGFALSINLYIECSFRLFKKIYLYLLTVDWADPVADPEFIDEFDRRRAR